MGLWFLPDGVGWNVGSLQLLMTVIAVGVDIGVVFRAVWVPLMRATRPEDRPYIFSGIADFARKARLAAEWEARMKKEEEMVHAIARR